MVVIEIGPVADVKPLTLLTVPTDNAALLTNVNPLMADPEIVLTLFDVLVAVTYALFTKTIPVEDDTAPDKVKLPGPPIYVIAPRVSTPE